MKNPVIGIIGGTGKMGQWMNHFFTSYGIKTLTAGRSTSLSPQSLVKKADIVIVSVPISETEKTIKKIIPLLSKNQLLADITSLKVMPLSTMEEAQSGVLGMHPLFGPSIASPHGQKIVFCKQKNNEYVDFLRNVFTKAGMEIIDMSADEHDYQMAYIQALTHSVNLMLIKTALEEEKSFSPKIFTPTFMLQSLVMGRVLQQDMALIADMQIYNPYFPPILHSFLSQGKDVLKLVESYDKKGFIQAFKNEQKTTQSFANFSMQQTDKILRLVEETPTSMPEKITAVTAPKKATVAYLGPEGTYSHKGTLRVFPDPSYRKLSCGSIYEIFMKVHEGDADFGVVPAENSIEGVVKGTLDYLIDFSLNVCGSFALPIHHQLVSKEKILSDITTVVSHPQALAQCQRWLRENLPTVKIIAAASTAEGLGKTKRGYAHIASEEAAAKYKLSVLAKDIEDSKDNATRFYVIAKHPIKFKELNNKKTLLFVTVYNRVGILKDILTVLAKYAINLTKLESRPSREKLWDYHFFIELEKEADDEDLAKALKELEAYCPVIRILGRT